MGRATALVEWYLVCHCGSQYGRSLSSAKYYSVMMMNEIMSLHGVGGGQESHIFSLISKNLLKVGSGMWDHREDGDRGSGVLTGQI